MSPSFTTVTPKIGNPLTFVLGLIAIIVTLLSTSQPVLTLEYEYGNHTFEFSSRSRIAHINADKNARAASVLLRLNATSEWNTQFSTLFEIDHVTLGWKDKFSNGEHFNGKPVIPDTAGNDLNQALLRYTPVNTLTFTLGREAVNFGNERFVGTNGFWQNEQTLDTTGFKYEFGSASSVVYRYVDNANRINGQDAGKKLSPSDSNFVANNGVRPAPFLGDHDHNTHLLFAELNESDFSKIHAYYFHMDIKDANALSNQTLGIRYEYKGRWHKLRTLAHGEFALQQRTEVNNNANLQYHDIGVGMGYRTNEMSVNYQRLAENDGISFVTPLASLHDKNGWADKFLATPNTGLRDYKLHYIWRKNPLKIDARYHVFHTDNSDSKIGEELDIDLILKLNRGNTILLRYADFIAHTDNHSDDQRVFLMYTHNL
ncbi:hypothetical protein ACU6U9_04355 [Pseudomonas sp. HK3]